MGNIINALFGKKKPAPAPGRDIGGLLGPLFSPAIQILVSGSPSRSYFGGIPNLPPDVAWPERNGLPLAFLARLSLIEIHSALLTDWLPQSGALLFFYDMDSQPWGFDPKDRGGWVVLLVPDVEPGSIPSKTLTISAPEALQHRHISFRRIDVPPSEENEFVLALNLTDKEWEGYFELRDKVFGAKAKHQVSGCPVPVQNDQMDLECQLASNGIYCGNPEGYKSPRAAELHKGRTNWRLLFQIDSDDDIGAMWGDVGMLYFWIEEQKARDGNFENAWLVLQCC